MSFQQNNSQSLYDSNTEVDINKTKMLYTFLDSCEKCMIKVMKSFSHKIYEIFLIKLIFSKIFVAKNICIHNLVFA